MKKDIERLYQERKLLVEQILPIEEKIAKIDDKIQDIKDACPHTNTKEIHMETLDVKFDICNDCGEWDV